MPTGLQVLNDNGDIVIDEEYRNFTLKTSGSVTMGSTDIGGTAPIYTVDIVVTNCTNPMLALKSSEYASVIGTNVSGSTYTFKVASPVASFSLSYWVFDVAILPADTFGFAVYNAAGDLVFHSSNKAMRIFAAYDAGTGGTGGNTLTTGRTFAVIQGANGFRVRNFYRALQNNWRYISYCAGHKFTGDILYIPYPSIALVMPASAPLPVDDVVPSGETFDYEKIPQTPKFIVVDVTNF